VARARSRDRESAGMSNPISNEMIEIAINNSINEKPRRIFNTPPCASLS
jgi:hypothetical protein